MSAERDRNDKATGLLFKVFASTGVLWAIFMIWGIHGLGVETFDLYFSWTGPVALTICGATLLIRIFFYD